LDDETTRSTQEEPAEAELERDRRASSFYQQAANPPPYQQAGTPPPEPIVTIESDTRGYWASSELKDGDGQ